MAVEPAEDDHFSLRQALKSKENRIPGWSSSRNEGAKRRIPAAARIANSLSSILCKDAWTGYALTSEYDEPRQGS